MKIRLFLGLLLVMLFTSGAVDAQHYHRGYRGGYRHGYHHRGPRAVVVINPGYHRRAYYGRGYRRGYYAGPRYHRGYYGRPHYAHRRHYYHRRGW